MSSPQLDTYLILGFATGLSSFFLALLLSQSFGAALFVSAIAIPASFAGGWLGLRWHIISSKQYRKSLYHQIRNYERKEDQVYNDLQEQLQTHQKLEVRVNSLSIQESQLQNHLDYLLNQRNKLQYEIESKHNYQEEQDLYYTKLKNILQKLREKEAQIQINIDNKNTFIQQKELRIRYLQSELDNKLDQKNALELEILALKQQKEDLGGEAYNLNTRINILSQKQDELQTKLFPSQLHKQKLETTSNILKDKPEELEANNQGFFAKAEKVKKDNPKILEEPWEDWQEWINLIEQLSNEEQLALEAIITEDEDKFKEILDLQCLMPQVLVEAINKKALVSLGDTILTANYSATLPEVHQAYYQALINALAKIK